jgi:uracil-DNA glycosylase
MSVLASDLKLDLEIGMCEKCSLFSNLQESCYPLAGRRVKITTPSTPIKFFFVTSGVSQKESLTELILTDASNEGQFFLQLLEDARIKEEECFVTSVVRCPSKKAPSVKNLETCSDWLEQELNLYQPRTIFTLGKLAEKRLSKKKIVALPSIHTLLMGGNEEVEKVVRILHSYNSGDVDER